MSDAPSYLIAPGRTLHHDRTVYPSGATAPTLDPSHVASLLAQGVLVAPSSPPAPPAPRPKTSAGPKPVPVGS